MLGRLPHFVWRNLIIRVRQHRLAGGPAALFNNSGFLLLAKPPATNGSGFSSGCGSTDWPAALPPCEKSCRARLLLRKRSALPGASKGDKTPRQNEPPLCDRAFSVLDETARHRKRTRRDNTHSADSLVPTAASPVARLGLGRDRAVACRMARARHCPLGLLGRLQLQSN